MTTSTRTRRPEAVVTELAPERQTITQRPRQPRQYFALNGVAMVLIAAVALSLIGILYLMQTAKVASLGYQFSDLQNKYYALSLDNSKLGYQVARDQSLDKIDQIATQQLGMTPLTSNFQFLQVERPANDNLPPIPADVQPRPSLLQRIKAAITGESSISVNEKSVTKPQSTVQSTPQAGTAATPQSSPVVSPQSTIQGAP